MKLQFLFGIILFIVGLVFYAYPAYQLNEAEDKIRLSMQNIPNNAQAYRFQSISGYSANAEVLNQYPTFLVYITLKDYKDKQAPEEVIEFIEEFSCTALDGLKSDSEIYRKAHLNIIKKDQHRFDYTLKNIYGDILYKHQQLMSNCPNFSDIENYEPPKETIENNHHMTTPVSPEAAARERQAENGY